MTTGTLGTVVLAGVTSGVLSIPGVVGVTSVCGEVVQVPFTSPGVVTTTGVERAGILASVVQVPFTSPGVVTTTGVERAGILASVVQVPFTFPGVVTTTGVERAGILVSVQVSSPVLVPEVGKVVFIGYVEIEWVVIVKVCVIGTVFGVSLIVTTVLLTGKSDR